MGTLVYYMVAERQRRFHGCGLCTSTVHVFACLSLLSKYVSCHHEIFQLKTQLDPVQNLVWLRFFFILFQRRKSQSTCLHKFHIIFRYFLPIRWYRIQTKSHFVTLYVTVNPVLLITKCCGSCLICCNMLLCLIVFDQNGIVMTNCNVTICYSC